MNPREASLFFSVCKERFPMIVLRGREEGARAIRDLDLEEAGDEDEEVGSDRMDFELGMAGSRIGMDESVERFIRPKTWPTWLSAS